MTDEAFRVPVQLKNCRFLRTNKTEDFARFLLNAEPGCLASDPSFGCRSPFFAPEYSDDLKTEIRNHLLDQFRKYMGITVNVTISDQVESLTASYTCKVIGKMANGEKFTLSWEV